MSRSRKKNVVIKDSGNGWAKKAANNAVKKSDVANGSAYKKAYCSWDICDWKWRAEKPKKGGTVRWGRRVDEETMAKEYRKARRK
jgi:hypothetical protein